MGQCSFTRANISFNSYKVVLHIVNGEWSMVNGEKRLHAPRCTQKPGTQKLRTKNFSYFLFPPPIIRFSSLLAHQDTPLTIVQ